MAKEKVIQPLSPVAEAVLKAIKSSPNGMTLADVKTSGVDGANSAHITALKTRELIEDLGEVEIVVSTKRKVHLYKAK
jgi:hypothetical protein